MTLRLISAHPKVDESIQEEWQGIADILAEFMEVPVALVMQFHTDTQQLSVFVRNLNPDNPFSAGQSEPCGVSPHYCDRVIMDKERLFVFDASADSVWHDNTALDFNLINYLGYPIQWPNGDVFGTLCILSTEAKQYSDKQERLMLQLRNLIESQLELLEKNLALQTLSRDLQYLANTDELTGIWNRRAFITESEKELNRAQRHQQACCLLMMDLDNFKQINDQFGHDVGDEVLRLFSHCIRASKRHYDVFGRIGGEEFSLLLPDTKRSEAIEQAERIRKKVADIFFHTQGQKVPITVSIGVCELATDVATILPGLGCADKMLYQAKREGKNRVCVG